MNIIDEIANDAPKLTHDAYLETLKMGEKATIMNEDGKPVEHQIVDGKLVVTLLNWTNEE
jgi:uncharacterized ubiquitin-like protein YukD